MGLCTLTLGFLIFNFPNLSADTVDPNNPLSTVNNLMGFGYIGVFSIVGAFIIAYQPRNTIGWLLMFVGISIAFLGFIPPVTQLAVRQQQGEISLGLLAFFAWVSGWSWWFLMGPVFLILQLFPTGRPLSPRWRWIIGLLALTFLYFITIAGLGKKIGAEEVGLSLTNPIGFLSTEDIEFLFIPFFGMLISTAILSVVAVGLRFVRGNTVERQQLKWFLSACALFLIVYISQIFTNTSDSDIGSIAFNLTIFAIPIAIGIAILRYRLFDIDVIIRRTLTYALVTALLAIIFFSSIVLLQTVFGSVFNTNQSELITVLSTLAIAALFVPVRNRIQHEIDKRFNRKKYNTQQVLNDFGKTVRDETDLVKLTARLMQVVDETMQPKTVSVWLKKDERRK